MYTIINNVEHREDIALGSGQEISDKLRVRKFGAGSDFGFHKPSRFFDLPTTRSESPAAGIGIGSVSVGDRKTRQKSSYNSSAL
jgi:hypothetical protein